MERLVHQSAAQTSALVSSVVVIVTLTSTVLENWSVEITGAETSTRLQSPPMIAASRLKVRLFL